MSIIWLVALAILMSTGGVHAQLAPQYPLTISTGTYSSISGTGTSVATGNDVGTNITGLPGFTVNGVTYTNARMGSNGWLALYTSSAPTTNTSYNPLSTAMTNGAVIFAPFGRDLNNNNGGTAWRQQVGNELVFEWKNFNRYGYIEVLNFQIRLNTSTGDIKFVYGTMTPAANTTYPQVGWKTNGTVASNWSTDINNVMINVTGSPNTCNWSNVVTGDSYDNSYCYFNSANSGVVPANGLTYTWTKPNATDPKPVRTFNAVANITSSSADLSWTAPTGATQYNIQYRAVGSCTWTNFSGNPVIGTSATLTGLSPTTTYQIRVQSGNGSVNGLWSHIPSEYGYGGYNASGTFKTLCSPASIPFSEGFESGYIDQTTVGGCWLKQIIAGSFWWTANNTANDYNRLPRTGGWNAYLSYSNTTWLFYPVALTGGTTYEFKAHARQDGSNTTNASLTLAYGSTPTNAGMTNTVANVGLTNGFYQLVSGIFTPASSGTYYIGIKGTINANTWYISLDDISLDQILPCTGTPASGNTISSDNTVCSGVNFMLSLQNSPSALGLTYQWQSADDAAFTIGVTNLGTSSDQITSQTAAKYYRCLVTCTNTGLSAYSTALQVTMSPTYATYNNVSYTESFESWVSGCSTFGQPSTSWLNSPNTGNASWRRNDQGGTAAWTSIGLGNYTPVSTDGTYSARFHSSELISDTKGSLSLYINMTAATGNTRLSFDHINTSGTDVLKVLISTDGGVTFSQVGLDVGVSATWTNKTFDFNSTSATTVIKLEATSYPAYSDIGIDKLKLEPGPACLRTTATEASNIGATTASANWSISPGSWIIEYGPTATFGTPGTGSTAGNVNNTVVTASNASTIGLTGLTPTTWYSYVVRQDCSGDGNGYSANSNVITFATTQIPASLPYNQNFDSNDFAFVNGTQTNKWAYGAATGNAANAIYVSNDGGTSNAYTFNAASVVHAYRDIAIPSGSTLATFSFDWKGMGNNLDYLRVWLLPASFVPTAGMQTYSGSGRIWVADFFQQSTWQTYSYSTLDVSSFAGQTMRLAFEWSNNLSGGTNPPSAVDNVSLALLPSCAGTPDAGTITAPLVRLTCNGMTPTPATAAATGYTTGVTGISLQWEVSTDNVNYTNASGPSATTATYTLPAHTGGQTEYYRLKITCAYSGLSDYSDVVVQVTDPAAPGTQASNITPSNVNSTTATVSWTNGSGTRRVVYLNNTNSFIDPVNGSGPALVANAAWQNAGQQIIFDDWSNSVNITNLSPTTTYYVRVYDYIRCGSGPYYDYYYNTSTATGNPNSFTTELYCLPSTWSGSTYYVSNFTTTGGTTNINNTSGGSATGYQDFHTTATMSAEVGPSINYSMTVAGGGTYGRAIWVDLNEDGIFQASEQLVSSSTYDPSPLTGSFTIPLSVSSGNKRMRIIASLELLNSNDACYKLGEGEYEDYTLTVIGCSGTPAPGSTNSSDNSVCPSVNFTLSLQNPASGADVTYQWQSADDAAFTMGVTSLGTSPTQTTSQTAAKYYRCIVTCANSGLSAYSTALLVTMEDLSNCYCTPSTGGGNTYYVSNFTTTGGTTNINNTSGGSTTGYQDFHTTAIMSADAGTTINYSMTVAGNDTYGRAIWVDLDEDGIFQASEQLVSSSSYSSSPLNGSFTIPPSTTSGNKRMRIVATYSPNNPSNACSNTGPGEYEDYTIIVTALPLCTGTPNAGTITAPLVRQTCGGTTPTPAIAAATGYTTGVNGISFQWEVSTDNNTYTDASGPSATTASYILPTHTSGQIEFYRMKITCTNSGLSDYSDVVVQVTDPVAPTTQASDILPSNVSNTTATVSWTNGSGDRRVVYINNTNSFTDPVNGSGPELVANSEWQNAGQQIIYDDTWNTVDITNLSPTTTYYVRVYDYVRCGSGPYDYYYNISTATDNPNSFTTELYCPPSTWDGSTHYISNFTTTCGTTNINNTSGGSSTGYQDFHTTATMSADAGITINYSMTVAGGNIYGRAIWVDLDEDGIFQASEQLGSSSSYSSSPLTGSFTIPLSASIGNKRMRILATPSPVDPSDACSNADEGEYEDYTLSVTGVASPCNGTPIGGTASVTPSSGQSGSDATWTVVGYETGSSGLTYDWQYSTDGGITWTSTGAGDIKVFTMDGPHGTEFQIRYAVSCTSSGWTGYSNVNTFTIDNTNCVPPDSNFGCYSENITSVTLLTLSDPDQTCTPQYEDRTGSQNAKPELKREMPISMSVGVGNGVIEVGVWIDSDGDGAFENAEFTDLGSGNEETVTGNITIPAGTYAGDVKMRVRTKYDWEAFDADDACAQVDYGTTRDYTVTIMKVNDDCAGAISISSDPITDFIDPGTQYMSYTSKSSVPDGSCFTTSPSSKDMWYKITTNGDNGSVLNLTVTPDASMDVALTLFDGTCGTLNAVACSNANSAGVAENMVYTLPLWDGGIEVRANKVYFLRVTDIGGNGTSFTIGNNGSTALPLTLLSFKAQQVKRGEVLLDWRVKDEVNMKQYDVQRSVDGKNFTTIGTVGNLGKEVYTLIDPKPEQGINYYRLSMVESNGLTNYSHIVAININDGKALHASPNPVTGDLTVEVKGEVGKQAVIDIIDYTGNKVRTVAIPAGKVTVDMTSLPTGVYVVQYIDGTTVYTTRVVKM